MAIFEIKASIFFSLFTVVHAFFLRVESRGGGGTTSSPMVLGENPGNEVGEGGTLIPFLVRKRTEKTGDRLNLRWCEGQTECQTGFSRHAGSRRLAYTAKQYISNKNAAIPE